MAQTHKHTSWNHAHEGTPENEARRAFRVVNGQEKQLFQSVEFLESRKNAVLASIGFHFCLLAVAIAIPLLFFDPPSMRHYYSLMMLTPPTPKEPLEVTHWKPIALPRPKPKPVVEPPLKPPVVRVEPKRPEPLPKPPKPEEVKLPEVKVQPKPTLLAKKEEKIPEPPKPVVKTNVFGDTGSSAKPTVDLPKAQVQTGGFGDPNGVKGQGRPDKPANIASLGSFDLPVGPGAGNGTGGAKGTRGVVASAGFGNGVASDVNTVGNGRAAQPTVQKGAFGDAAAAVPAAAPKKREAEESNTSVEITFKPRPDYTKEARDKKIEGEVLVRFLFTASGQIKVLGVSRGLGYGLDEAAVRAAEQIRFKPSTRAGSPVDSTATVHILFQLAY